MNNTAAQAQIEAQLDAEILGLQNKIGALVAKIDAAPNGPDVSASWRSIYRLQAQIVSL